MSTQQFRVTNFKPDTLARIEQANTVRSCSRHL